MVKKSAKNKDVVDKHPRSKVASLKDDGPLSRSFRQRQKGPHSPGKASMASASGASSVASSSDGLVPRKVATGGFLMYIKSALNGRCQETSDQAQAVQDAYTTMSSQEKKSLVDGFWKAGGKKNGLAASYQQCLKIRQACKDKQWEGYLTVGTLMSLWGVSL